MNLEQHLRASNNRPTGFDYLRVVLSIAIIGWHTVLVCYGKELENQLWASPIRPLIFFLVPSFFALSGFLVAGSLVRNDLPTFLTLRGIRIYPALAIEAVLSAFLLGPIVTALPLNEYFQDSEFRSYLLNVIGYVHYHLPGVFLDNPGGRSVNEQLWTIPYELECYVTLAILALVGLTRHPKKFLGLLCAVTLFILAYQIYYSKFPPASARPPGRMTVLAFLFGAAIYFLKDKIPHSKFAFAAAIGACVLIFQFPEANYLAPFPVAYATIYMGSLNPPKGLVTRLADYSYGLYLYGFPVQQTLAHLLPQAREWYINLPLSVMCALILSAISWHFVEKPIMDRRSKATKFVQNACAPFKARLGMRS